MNKAAWRALAELLRGAIQALDTTDVTESERSETLVSALDVVMDIIGD